MACPQAFLAPPAADERLVLVCTDRASRGIDRRAARSSHALPSMLLTVYVGQYTDWVSGDNRALRGWCCCAVMTYHPGSNSAHAPAACSAHVDHVVLFDFPRDPSEYVRRAGRTSRGAGNRGTVTILALGRQARSPSLVEDGHR